jgi:hypothetical protein
MDKIIAAYCEICKLWDLVQNLPHDHKNDKNDPTDLSL